MCVHRAQPRCVAESTAGKAPAAVAVLLCDELALWIVNVDERGELAIHGDGRRPCQLHAQLVGRDARVHHLDAKRS